MTENDPSTTPRIWRILLAEDNSHDQLLLEEAFLDKGHDVMIEAVTNGDDLLRRLVQLAEEGERAVHLVVMDVHLPKLSAEDVLEELRHRGILLQVPVVVVSSFISERQKARLRALAANDVLVKPFDLTEYFEFADHLIRLAGGRCS